MAEGKKSFILYSDLLSVLEKLPDELAGKLFKIILEYVNDKNPVIDDLLLQIAFEPIKLQLKRDLVKWDEFKEKQSKNGKLGGRPKTQKNPENPSLFLETQKSLNVNVNDNVTDIFIIPTFEQFDLYCSQNGFSSISKRAYEYYSTANWKDSRGKKIKNWKQKLQGVWFKEENKDKKQNREGATKSGMVY